MNIQFYRVPKIFEPITHEKHLRPPRPFGLFSSDDEPCFRPSGAGRGGGAANAGRGAAEAPF